jgi:hypothetical protein
LIFFGTIFCGSSFLLLVKFFVFAPFFVLGCPNCPAERAVVSAWQFWRWEGRGKKTYGGSVSKRDETKEREKKKINGRDLTQTKGMKRKTERGKILP